MPRFNLFVRLFPLALCLAALASCADGASTLPERARPAAGASAEDTAEGGYIGSGNKEDPPPTDTASASVPSLP